MRIPTINPAVHYVYTTRQAIKALQIGSATFYRYAKLLGLRGVQRNQSKATWWTYDQLAMIFQAMVIEHMKRKGQL